jgi:hypothetical protein
MMLVFVLWQATPAAALKRSRPTSPTAEPQPQPLPTRPLPTAVWEDHLLPWVTHQEAVRLGLTCKALRGMVREHFRHIGRVDIKKLRAALTTFPRARSVQSDSRTGETWEAGESEALVEWLRAGGHGRNITTLVSWYGGFHQDYINFTVHAALRGGALPSLKTVAVNLEFPSQRAILTDGLLGGMHELQLRIVCSVAREPQLAALSLVRQLPALAKLELAVVMDSGINDPVQWPPFIPSTLKALYIDLGPCHAPLRQSPLHALPGMLGASGARLERFDVKFPGNLLNWGDGLVQVAQALHCCSITLKDFRVETYIDIRMMEGAADRAERMERLRVQWTDVMAGVSACRELQVLLLTPPRIKPLFPPSTYFARLTHLEIYTEHLFRPCLLPVAWGCGR